jgi:GNAT superfamily N-acetyltransferase
MVTYRQATLDDVPALIPRLGELMTHHGVDAPTDDELRDSLTSALSAPNHFFIIAQVEEQVAGMCALLFTFSTWSLGLACELQDVYVADDFRRRGIGHGLLEAATQFAKDHGCVRLYLLAEYWNLDAHAFYRSAGLAEKTSLCYERSLR